VGSGDGLALGCASEPAIQLRKTRLDEVIPATFPEVGIDKWFSWRRTTTAYVAVSAVVLVASALVWTPAGPLTFAFALLGPIAWLFWGVPLFLMAIIAFALSVLGAVALQGRSSALGWGCYWLLPAVVWIALGAWALLVNV
jgi:hypothetical protein